MKANKKVMAALLAAMMSVSAGAAVVSADTAVAGPGSSINNPITNKGWFVRDVNGKTMYYYKTGDNTYASGWKMIDGSWYYFAGWDGSNYVPAAKNTNDAATVHYAIVDSKVTGDQVGYSATEFANDYFRFNKEGKMITGWYQASLSGERPTDVVGNGWEYYNSNGVSQTGWIKDGANWFCIVPWVGNYYSGAVNPNVTDVNGNPVKEGTLLMNGTYNVYGVKYTFAANGVMQNQGQGWVKDGDRWYYINEKNQYATMWNEINGKWYYMAQSDFAQLGGMKDVKTGQMLTGWQQLQFNNTDTTPYWFYFTSNGDLVMNNWIQTNGNWYLVDASGRMMTGWVVRGGKTYHLKSNGVMSTGTWKDIYNNTFTHDANGALISVNGQSVPADYVPGN